MIDDILGAEVNHTVRIDDQKTMDDLLELASGRTINFGFLVKEKRVVKIGKETNTFLDVRHRQLEVDRLILVRQFENLADIFVFEKPDFWEEESRAVVINNHPWLFDTAVIRQSVCDYPFAEEIQDGDGNLFTRVLRDEMGPDQGLGVRTAIVEWKGNPSLDNDRVLVLEVGTLDGVVGGFMEFYEGRLVEEYNVSV